MKQHNYRPGTRGRRALVMSLAMAAAITLGGCASTQNEASRTPGAAGVTAAAVATGSGAKASGGSTAGKEGKSSKDAAARKSQLPKPPKGVSTAKPKDPLAPKAIKQVIRNGKKPDPTVKVKGGTKTFTKPVVYTDGLQLRITKMTQGKMAGQGAGVYPGSPVTNFYATLTNRTKKVLKIGVVVVTVTYGSPQRRSRAVYGPASEDFSGAIKPGNSAKAVYGFSVPPADLANVTMVVDIDGSHQLATFTGRVK